MFEIVDFQVQTGQIIPCAKQDNVLVALAKIQVYAFGKVAMYPQAELRQLQTMKQRQRKDFDRDPANEARLTFIKKLRHNYERSQAMLRSLQVVGISDSTVGTEQVIQHLLDVGMYVTIETRLDYLSRLAGTSGSLKILSTWTILPDDMKYLSTLKFIPEGEK